MKKILIIEQDNKILESSSSFLKEEGFKVFTCNNCNEGIRIATVIIPDAIVSDINTSDVNEFEICKAMQSAPSTSKIPIIFIAERWQDIQKGMQIGVDEFLPKPFSLKQLLKTINNIITDQPKLFPVFTNK
jgi:DNA-binding response OmpR family regulator